MRSVFVVLRGGAVEPERPAYVGIGRSGRCWRGTLGFEWLASAIVCTGGIGVRQILPLGVRGRTERAAVYLWYGCPWNSCRRAFGILRTHTDGYRRVSARGDRGVSRHFSCCGPLFGLE